jgi:ElaB/YqjD/DUF883 family membrane-anchored ribosome-binding protein
MSTDLGLLDELPADARALLDQAEAELNAIRDQAERDTDEVRTRADRAMEEIRERSERALGEIRARRERESGARLRQLVEALKPLQESYARAGKLDEALAIRDRIRQMRVRLLNVRPDPGTLADFQLPQDGDLLFEVVGSDDGSIWGTDVYTSDSDLATAAVHAGVLRNGERGIVRVTLVDGLNVAFNGTERHGVWSHDYGDYPLAYRVSKA